MKKLLLADDSITIQKVIGITFANDDFDLTIVGDGDAALEKALTVAPDLVLADVYMPGKNGYEVCEAIKANPAFAHVPVMLLTGTFEAFDEERAKSVGADDWIAKPFESQVLIEKVRVLLEKGGAVAPVQKATATPPAAPVVEPASELDSGWEDDEPIDDQDDDIWGSVSFDDEEEEISETVDDGDIWGDVDLEDEKPEAAPVQTNALKEDITPVEDDELEDDVVFLDDNDILIDDEFDEIDDADIEEIEEGVVEESLVPPEPIVEASAPQPFAPSPPVVEQQSSASSPALTQVTPVPAPTADTLASISPELIEEIVRKVAAEIVERIAWEVVPDLAESMIKEEIRKIKENL